MLKKLDFVTGIRHDHTHDTGSCTIKKRYFMYIYTVYIYIYIYIYIYMLMSNPCGFCDNVRQHSKCGKVSHAVDLSNVVIFLVISVIFLNLEMVYIFSDWLYLDCSCPTLQEANRK